MSALAQTMTPEVKDAGRTVASELEDLLRKAVVRPSGIWNTRAPFHSYRIEINDILRNHALLTVAVARTRFDAEHAADSGGSASSFVRSNIAGPVMRRAWTDYRDIWRRRSGSTEGQPSIADVSNDLALALYAIREWAVISYSAALESFAQCWALNMLLARLEAVRSLSRDEARLALRFSPLAPQQQPPPGLPEILKTFPTIRDELERAPHITTDPLTLAPVTSPVHPKLTALRTIFFWRAYRNLIVHHGGRITTTFLTSYGEAFEAIRANYPALRQLELGHRLQLPPMIVPAVATTHNKVAKMLNEALVIAATGRRGKLTGPSDSEPTALRFELVPPPMLTEGDHAMSLRWVRDEELRERVLPVVIAHAARTGASEGMADETTTTP